MLTIFKMTVLEVVQLVDKSNSLNTKKMINQLLIK